MTRAPATLAALAALAALLVGAQADAHRLEAYVSSSGLNFIERTLPRFVPSELALPVVEKELGCMTARFYDTDLNLDIHDLKIDIPAEDTIRIDLTISASSQGMIYLDDVYACLGSTTCEQDVSINNTRAVVEFSLAVESGQPVVKFREIDIQLDSDDLEVDLDDCVAGEVVDAVIGISKGFLLESVLNKVEKIAIEKLGPKVQEMMGSMSHYGMDTDMLSVRAGLDTISIDTAGILAGVQVDLVANGEASDCIGASDTGEPATLKGSGPNLQGSVAHLSVAANLGLINDALYQVWRSGKMCMTTDSLAQFGFDTSLIDHAGDLIPGMPPGSHIDLSVTMRKPPRMRGELESGANLTLIMEETDVVLTGHAPSGETHSLMVTVGMEATLRTAINPGTNAINISMAGARLTQLLVEEQLGLVENGLDPARMQQVLNNHMLPKLMKEMGEIPVTGSVFSFGELSLLLRGVSTTEAYLSAKVDFYAAPLVDTTAPDTTIIASPVGPSSPELAVFFVGGNDREVPVEMLRYRVVVDGESRPLSSMREFNVGEMGETRAYEVEVYAVDLKGNEDPSPARAQVMIDGIAPLLYLDGPHAMKLDSGDVSLSFTASDDLSLDERLAGRVEVYKLLDDTDALSAELVNTVAITAGQSSTSFAIDEDGGVYRAEVIIVDEAGNEARSSVMLDAPGGGCSVGGRGQAGYGLFFGLFMAMMVLRRRRP